MKRRLCLSGLTLICASMWCGPAVSATGGEIYKVRVSDGCATPSLEFLRSELERIERPR
jgi:hypothetical protein